MESVSKTDELQIAALREEIRRAGALTQRLRNLAAVIGFAGLLLGLVIFVAAALWDNELGALVVEFWLAIGFVPAALIGYGAVCGLARRSRRAHRERLRRMLSPMLSERRSTVVSLLYEFASDHENGDSGAIVRPLLQDFDSPSEVIPAVQPSTRGGELAPTEYPGEARGQV